MKREAGGPCLSAVFVDYDNIYLSLKRKSEDAAKRFAKDAAGWLREIENGGLITPTNAAMGGPARRIVMNRCYGNPVPRRNAHDNSTDMNSFPFVRHHFLRAGFEVIDCPPLTAQLKNSADIRMVMDIRDSLTHETYFDEFIILSGDADFTPLLHRLRAHARRTVIFANDFTAAPYTAISDAEVREADLIALILNGALPDKDGKEISAPTTAKLADARRDILAEVIAGVRSAAAPVPLEALADRAVRALGHEKTIATGWAGAGSFRELLRQELPEDVRLSGEPPYLAYDAKRHSLAEPEAPQQLAAREPAAETAPAPARKPAAALRPAPAPAPEPPTQAQATPQPAALPQAPPAASAGERATGGGPIAARAGQQVATAAPARPDASTGIQQSIARIQEACQAPPLAPPEYRLLFEIMAKEINDNDLIGAQTLTNITQQAQQRGLEVRRDDVRFVLEVVSEADPWFEQGASANLFAGRFRNFVVARCRGQGLNLSAEELDLIDAWFAGAAPPQGGGARGPAQPIEAPAPAPQPAIARGQPAPQPAAQPAAGGSRWWSYDDGRQNNPEPQRPTASARLEAAAPHAQAPTPAHPGADEFPRIVRTRLRG